MVMVLLMVLGYLTGLLVFLSGCFFQGVLKSLGVDQERKVLLADSFQGFPDAVDGEALREMEHIDHISLKP